MVRSLFLVLSTVLLASCGGGNGGSSSEGGPQGFAPLLSVDGVQVSSQPVTVMVDENTTDVAMISSSAGTPGHYTHLTLPTIYSG